MPQIKLIERIAMVLADPYATPSAYGRSHLDSEVRREAADILSEAFDVVEWRFGIVIPWKVERLAIELARHHRAHPVECSLNVDDRQGKLCL
jgi:hypothetical protein